MVHEPTTRRRRRQRVTIRQVAKAANLSPTAVSMARQNHPQISEKTRQRVLRICRELGYVGTRREAVGGRVGFVLLGTKLENTVHGVLLQNLTKAAAASELTLELHSFAEDDAEDLAASTEDHTARTLEIARKVDGLFLCGEVGAGLLTRLAAIDVPVVVIGGAALPVGELPLSGRMMVVACDYAGEGEFATSRMLACGHRRIGFVSERIYPGLSHSRWLAGYSAAHGLAGVPLDPRLVRLAGALNSDMSTVADAFAAMPPGDRPTAYVIPDVRQAWAFVQAMHRRAIDVPRDSVIMHGNHIIVQQYQMQDYPMTLTDYGHLAQMAVWHLQALRAQQTPSTTTKVLLPFTGANLPEPPARKSEPTSDPIMRQQ
jgi:LacI family transcriptional regulator